MEKLEGCYLLVGEDSWSKNKWIEQAKKEILVDLNDMMNYLEAKDKEVIVSNIIDFAETLPFFVDKKLIYLKDTGLFKAGKKDETEKFEAFIQKIPDYIVMLIDENEVDKRGKLYKTIKSKHHIKEFDYPGEEVVYSLLMTNAKEKQVMIEQGTMRYFIRNMPENIPYILTEWEKLLGYVESNTITKEDIDAVCVFSLEQRVFEMVKRIAQHQGEMALGIYSRLIQSKESPIGILVLIARQYRMLMQVKYLLAQRKQPKEISIALKIPFFAVQEMINQAQGYSFKQLETIVGECLQVDKDIKTGKMEASKRVEILIMHCLNTQ